MSTTPERSGGVDTILLVRLAAASVLLAVSLVLELSELLRTVLLAAAVVAAGYDIALEAVRSVLRKDFFAAPETNCQGLFNQVYKEVTFCGLPHGADA